MLLFVSDAVREGSEGPGMGDRKISGPVPEEVSADSRSGGTRAGCMRSVSAGADVLASIVEASDIASIAGFAITTLSVE